MRLHGLRAIPIHRVVIMLAILACATDGNAAEITHGPILGRLDSDGIGVWGRTSRPDALRVRYGLKPDALDRVSESASTLLERDNTGWVHLEGLESSTKYYYRLETVTGFIGQGGAFRTLPEADDVRNPEHNPRGLFNFSFEFACGNKPNPDPGSNVQRPAFVTMLRELDNKIDFAILNGDWIYERQRDYTAGQ